MLEKIGLADKLQMQKVRPTSHRYFFLKYAAVARPAEIGT
jgi:hypothetical protein